MKTEIKKNVDVWTKSRWKKEADYWFSKYIRQRDKGQCYTCKNKNEPKKMQNGHFVPRQYLLTRYDEINNHCQCYACNILYGGQPDTYALNLERDYGKGIIEKLNAKRNEIKKDTDFQFIANEYKKKYEEMISVDK